MAITPRLLKTITPRIAQNRLQICYKPYHKRCPGAGWETIIWLRFQFLVVLFTTLNP